jgi:hypothetical protein
VNLGGFIPRACRECVIPAEAGSESGAGAGIQQGPTGFPRIKYGAGVSSTEWRARTEDNAQQLTAGQFTSHGPSAHPCMMKSPSIPLL